MTFDDFGSIVKNHIEECSKDLIQIQEVMVIIASRINFVMKIDKIQGYVDVLNDCLVNVEEVTFSEEQRRMKEDICACLNELKDFKKKNVVSPVLVPMYIGKKLDVLFVRALKLELEEMLLVSIRVVEGLTSSPIDEIGPPFPGWEAVASMLDGVLNLPGKKAKISEAVGDIFAFESTLKTEITKPVILKAIVASQQILEEIKSINGIPYSTWEWCEVMYADINGISSDVEQTEGLAERVRAVCYGIFPPLAHAVLTIMYKKFPVLKSNELITDEKRDMLVGMIRFVQCINYYGCSRASSPYVEKVARNVYLKSHSAVLKLRDTR